MYIDGVLDEDNYFGWVLPSSLSMQRDGFLGDKLQIDDKLP